MKRTMFIITIMLICLAGYGGGYLHGKVDRAAHEPDCPVVEVVQVECYDGDSLVDLGAMPDADEVVVLNDDTATPMTWAFDVALPELAVVLSGATAPMPVLVEPPDLYYYTAWLPLMSNESRFEFYRDVNGDEDVRVGRVTCDDREDGLIDCIEIANSVINKLNGK